MVLSRINEVDKQFFTPRTYQQELVEKARQRNCIVPLGTGTGKTFIAVMLIREMAADVRAPISEGGRVSVFLVDKVALALQQSEVIECHTNLKVGVYHGRRNTDLWSEDQWYQELFNHQVLVMTAQIFLDVLNHGYLRLDQVNLIVMDECHHALGDGHPYRQIMRKYAEVDGAKAPRVLGLTASVVSRKIEPNKLEQTMTQLEGVLRSTIETASDLVTVAQYGARPREVVVVCRDSADVLGAAVAAARGCLDGARRFCSDANFDPTFDLNPTRPVLDAVGKTIAVLDQLGPWSALRVCPNWEKQLRKLKKQTMTEMQQLFIELGQTYIGMAKRMLADHVGAVKSLDDFLRFLPDRVRRLIDVLKLFNPAAYEEKHGKPMDDFSCIIFVEQRYIAYALKILLKCAVGLDKDNLGYLKNKIDFLVGYSGYNLPTEEQMALHRRQEDVLRNFRQKKLSVVISTNVLEEGVDVRQCNVVIRFDLPKEFRSYVQSKGRARKEGSYYFVLVEEESKEAFGADLRDYGKIERILLKHCHSRSNPPAEDIDANWADTLQPPYAPAIPKEELKTDAQPCVYMSTAIALVNRYCAKLPSDLFTRLTPLCDIDSVVEQKVELFRASLQLPINSPVKQKIVGPLMPNRKLAQMAVALRTVRVLHAAGELNNHLLPIGKESVLKLLNELDDNSELDVPGHKARPGSAKRKQYYAKKTADALVNARPTTDDACFVHVIDMHLKTPVLDALNPKKRRVVDPADCAHVFGILSLQAMPQIPAFPIFTRQGEVTAKVRTLAARVKLEPEQLPLLEKFHEYLFSAVLRLEKYRMKFSPGEASNAVYVVPLRKTGEDSVLDWKFIRSTVDAVVGLPRRPSDEERQAFQFDASKYADAVVMPWYRNQELPHFYYVAQVSPQLNPSSNFPDDEWQSFDEYFQKKYSIEIYNRTQPLLDVDYTSGRLNLLLPRFVTRRGQPLKSLVDRPSQQCASIQRQLLVPELVDVHPIPASMWAMVEMLPTALYRINALLIADELRVRVASEGFGRSGQLEPSFEWPDLDYGWQKNLDAYMAAHAKAAGGGDATDGETYTVATGAAYEGHTKELSDAAARDAATAAAAIADQSQDDSFEIGIWDPDDAAQFDWSMPRGPIGGDYDELAGLSAAPDMDTDDFDDDEDVVFDVEFSKHAMRMSRANADAATDECSDADAFQPRVDIEPTGWDGALLPPPSADDSSQVLNLVGCSSVDSQSLLRDINQLVLEPTLPAGAASSAQQADDDVDAKRKAPIELHNGSARKTAKVAAEPIDDDIDRLPEEEVLPESVFNIATEAMDDDSGSDDAPLDVQFVDHVEIPPEVKRKAQRDSSKERPAEKPSALVPLLAAPKLQPIDLLAPGLFGIANPMNYTFEADTTSTNLYGPSPCLLLQALTMSNATDGINLERLETVGDSFLKYAVTHSAFNEHRDWHEGLLSLFRSRQVSNFTLYHHGKDRDIPPLMVAAKFEPHDNWLPPAYCAEGFAAPNPEDVDADDRHIGQVLDGAPGADSKLKVPSGWDCADGGAPSAVEDGVETIDLTKLTRPPPDDFTALPYNMLTQQSIPDKSVADAVEALIGVYLLTYGPRGAINFMVWLGLSVVPSSERGDYGEQPDPLLRPMEQTGDAPEPIVGPTPEQRLHNLWVKCDFGAVENTIGYRFRNKAYLVQAFTHASYFPSRITDCYQRLEFLGDAVLDYMITRHLYEDVRQHTPGVLTDLRSALVNNTIFASLAIQYNFHKYFLAICPGLFAMIDKFGKLCKERRSAHAANFHDELLLTEEECEEGSEEDVEVPKAMGDIFESVAGAVFLDSGCSLDTVWSVFYRLMKDLIDRCCSNPPKSPIRELMEMEPENARFACDALPRSLKLERNRFSKLERNIETGKVKVTVDIYKKCRFTGMGRNYRIAKCTAAKRALRYLKALKAQRDAQKGAAAKQTAAAAE